MIVRKIPSVLPKFEDMLDQVLNYDEDQAIHTRNITFIPQNIFIAVIHNSSITLFQAISLAEHDINDVDCELKLDYKVGINTRI